MQAFLLFSHQLFPQVAEQSRTSVIYLIEDARLFKADANPARAIFHRAALQAIRERLLVKGFAVRYLGADEFPQLDNALAVLAKEHPEVVRFYDLGDKSLQKQLMLFLDKEHISFQVFPSPGLPVKTGKQPRFVPKILPPVEPNRYVEEAALYYGQLVPVTQEIEFAYPVTRGDAEEWLEFLPDLIEQGDNLQSLAEDIAPLLSNGLLDLRVIEEEVPPAHWPSFRSLLIN